MKQRLPLFILLAVSLLLAGCKKEENEIRVGIVFPLSGPAASIGVKMQHGAEFAIEEWNEKGGVLGKKIVPVVRDDEGKPNQAVAVAQELIAENIHALIGHLNTGCTIPASIIYAQSDIPQITVSNDPQVTSRGISSLFCIIGDTDCQGEMIAAFARQKLALKKIAVLHNKTPGGQAVAESLKKKYLDLGGEVVLYSGIAGEEQDFRATISAIKESGAEAVFFGGFYTQGGPLFNQMRQAGCDLPLIGPDAFMDQELIHMTGRDAQNLYAVFVPDFSSKPEVQPFLNAYRAKYGDEGAWAIYAYQSVNVYLQAVQQAGTANPKKVAEAMHRKTFPTSLGQVRFDANGGVENFQYVMWTVQNGKFIPCESLGK